MERFFTYFSIKFDNLYLKWNFLRISLWKWKKWILFYERSPSNIILIENTKLFFYLFIECVYIYNLLNKKVCVYIYICVCVCVYIIKKKRKRVCVCIYIYICIYVCGVVLINILVPQLGSLQTKIPDPAPEKVCH